MNRYPYVASLLLALVTLLTVIGVAFQPWGWVFLGMLFGFVFLCEARLESRFKHQEESGLSELATSLDENKYFVCEIEGKRLLIWAPTATKVREAHPTATTIEEIDDIIM